MQAYTSRTLMAAGQEPPMIREKKSKMATVYLFKTPKETVATTG